MPLTLAGMAQLTFCGAAGTVTGSCSHVETAEASFLVDCGMYQGNRTIKGLNAAPFPFDATKVDFLVLTHAHIDHSGLVPKLAKAGFRGPIYTTAATADLLEFMMLDSAAIQESDAARKSARKMRRGEKPVEPIYTSEDAEQALSQLHTVEYEDVFEPAPGVRIRFWNAGHMLGSASAEVVIREAGASERLRILFSGDLGPEEKAFHPEPDAPEGFDYIVCESTYGARERDDYTLEGRRAILRGELTRALSRGGNVVIPSFAVERSQELLHDIGVLLANKEIPEATVFLDSPLARKVTEVFIKHAAALQDIDVDEDELFRNKRFKLVRSVDESKAINDVKKGAIIISASGMCDAGRVKHHLKNNVWRAESTVLFVGYQAPGTLGHIITGGAKKVRIHGKECVVRAQIRRIGNYSAHAYQRELVDWVLEREPIVGGLFLNHGEDSGREAMRDVLVELGFSADKIFLPRFDESFELVAGSAKSKGRAQDERVQESQIVRDWHNDFAAFTLDLATELRTCESDGARSALIARLVAAMRAESAPAS